MITFFGFHFVFKDAIYHCPSSPDAGGNDCFCGERNFYLDTGSFKLHSCVLLKSDSVFKPMDKNHSETQTS